MALIAIILTACATPVTAQPARSTADLDFLVGRWRGEGAFLRPFRPGAEPIPEAVAAECRYILSNAYIQCDSVWTRADGRARSVMMLWTYNEASGDYEGVFLASTTGSRLSYAIRWDETERAYVGVFPFQLPDGRAATERAIYRLSEDHRTLQVDELVRPDDVQDGAWSRSYTYTWRRIGAGG